MNTMINIKTDKKLKIEAQRVAKDIGVSLSAVIANYLRQFVDEKQATFTAHPIPNKRTSALLKKIQKDISLGKNMNGPFNSAKEMMRSLSK